MFEIKKKRAEADAEPDILIQINFGTVNTGEISAECIVYVADEDVGNESNTYINVFECIRVFDRVSVTYAHRSLLAEAAEYLKEKDYSGVVQITGNQISVLTRLDGTGITCYKVPGSSLYLSPYSNYRTKVAARSVYISYDVKDIPKRDRQIREEMDRHNQGITGVYGRVYPILDDERGLHLVG